jgi:hypothetical protein
MGEVIALYLHVARDSALIEKLNERIGYYVRSGGHGVGEGEIEDNISSWDYEGYDVTLAKNLNSLQNYEPLEDYFSITVSKYNVRVYHPFFSPGP